MAPCQRGPLLQLVLVDSAAGMIEKLCTPQDQNVKHFAPAEHQKCLMSSLVLIHLLQVDSAAGMIEKLCTPQDEEHNEHKRLQLRELAALNGTLKDLEACYLCGEEGHAPEHCPNKALEVYK